MSFYNDRVLPFLIHHSMRNREFLPYRRRVLEQAQGRVLEIGIGSGLNLPCYGSGVRSLLGLEPSARLLSMAQRHAEQVNVPLIPIAGSAESIPLDTQSIDTVISTWTLCSIPDVPRALREVRRVLKPEGRFLFVEHGAAPEPAVRKWQDRLTPLWKRLGGGCHLNRRIDALIAQAGFKLARLEMSYADGPRFAAFFYEGCAQQSLEPTAPD